MSMTPTGCMSASTTCSVELKRLAKSMIVASPYTARVRTAKPLANSPTSPTHRCSRGRDLSNNVIHDGGCSFTHLPVMQLGTEMQRLFEAAGHFVPSGMQGVESCRRSSINRTVLRAAGLRSMKAAKTTLEVEFSSYLLAQGGESKKKLLYPIILPATTDAQWIRRCLKSWGLKVGGRLRLPLCLVF